jgi:predicted nucleic acid-binding protein
VLLATGSALACYQDKKPAQPASDKPPANASASLGLSPVPATHDTAIREIDRFALTPTVFHQLLAAKRQLDQLYATNPEVEDGLKNAPPPKDVAEAGARIDATPKMHEALAQAGMSGKDFLLASIALSQAMKGYQLKAVGKLDASRVPPVVLSNIDFVSTHMPEIMGSLNMHRARAPR